MCALRYQCLADICLVSIDRRWICFPWRIEYLILRNPPMFQKACLCHGEPVGVCKYPSSSGHKPNNFIGPREVTVVGPRTILQTNKILISGMVYTDIRVVSVLMTVLSTSQQSSQTPWLYVVVLVVGIWLCRASRASRSRPMSSVGSWKVFA